MRSDFPTQVSMRSDFTNTHNTKIDACRVDEKFVCI